MGKDKWLHLGVCAAVSLMVAGVGRVIGWSLAPCLYAGVLTSLGVGMGKEVADAYCGYNKWDWGDFVADIIGTSIGCTLMWLITG